MAFGEMLSSLYFVNSKRQAARPTMEQPLRTFCEIPVTGGELLDRTLCHVTPLSELRRSVQGLLSRPVSRYPDLGSLAP